MTAVFLPGLQGVDGGVRGFAARAPAHIRVESLTYPEDPRLDYEQLAAWAFPRLPKSGPYCLIAESFSGPVGILLARARPPGLRFLVLCNSFITAPASALWRFFPWTLLFRIPGPSFFIRRYCVGREGLDDWAEILRARIRAADPHVLASRMHLLLTCDFRQEASQTHLPVLDLRGDGDHLVPARTSVELRRALPQLVSTILKGPHFLLQVRPDESWRTIESFRRHLDESSPYQGY